MLQNLQQLPLSIWLAAAVAIAVASLAVRWFRQTFELAGFEFPFKVIFKRREKETPAPVTSQPPTLLTAPPPPATIPTLRPAREFGVETSGVSQSQLTVGDVAGRDLKKAEGDYLEAGAVKNVYEAAPLPLASGSGIPPSRAARFVDRGPIVDRLRKAIRAESAAAIVGVGGMGGVGKTELARFLANEIEDTSPGSVLWITVADRPLADVHRRMAGALGVTFPPNADAQSRYEILLAALGSSRRTVILDDIRAGFKPHLPFCLPPTPPCAALVTSRQIELPGLPLGAMHSLDVMTEAQALELLRGVEGLAELAAREEQAANDMCRLCGYHPLALDLAARRLLKRLHDSRAPIAAFTQNLKDRLAQLKTVWGESEDQARDSIERLQNASLVLPAETAGRFQLHDLLHEFARLKLREAEERDAAHRAHGEFLIALFGEHYTGDPSTAPGVTHELDNLRAAAEWARANGEGRLLALLATKPRNWLYNVFRAWDVWESWLTAALQVGIEDKQLEANVLKAIGDVQSFRAERDAALESYRQALDLFRAVGARLGEANVLRSIGDVQSFRKEN
ncbi:MAG: hypothetical protein HY023_02155, partial [Chloroflexi bacterium]|nr:hypothetical protein [Chloroflexota bacterium]